MPASAKGHVRDNLAAGPVHLLLENANVLTPGHAQSKARAVAVRGGTIAAVGNAADMAHLRGGAARVIDCQGMTLLPGFADAHCHLLAAAAALQGLNCSPEALPIIERLKQAVRRRGAATPHGRWVRGFGYDELSFREKRHPTRWDLDEETPHHPVRLDHRSGHAVVLNSLGLELAGIRRDTPDPVDGVIDRDLSTGEPTGLLLEMSGFLRDRLGRLNNDDEFQEGVSRLDRMLLSYGITSAQDAGPNNDVSRWSTFRGLQSSGRLSCRVTMMAGASHIKDFLAAGLAYGDSGQRLGLGHAKLMLTLTTGALQPDIEFLGEMVREAHRAGFPVAVHAVEQEAVAAAAEVLTANPLPPPLRSRPGSLSDNREPPPTPSPGAGTGSGPTGENPLRRQVLRDRIEHCAECPPALAARIARSGAAVVTQPGFVYWNGDRYRERVAPSTLGHLYPVDELLGAGVEVAFGSDAPVIDPNPWPAIYSAVTGAAKSGEKLHPKPPAGRAASRKVPVELALRMYTAAGAALEGRPERKGTISPGELADLVLVDRDPTKVDPSELKNIQAELTVLGGEVVWER